MTCFDHQGGGISIEGRSNEVLPRGTLIASGGSIQSQPVTVMLAAGPQILVFSGGGDIVYPALHAVKLIFQDLLVAEGKIYLPGTDGSSVAPGSAGLGSLDQIGDHMTYIAIRR